MLHAGKRRLDHELVSGVAAGHKTKWCLYFHARFVCQRVEDNAFHPDLASIAPATQVEATR